MAMSIRSAAARIAARWHRRPTPQERLLAGETIPLHLGRNLVIDVHLHDGLTKTFIEDMDDDEGRELLYASRLALTFPQPRRRRGNLTARPHPTIPGQDTIPIALSHPQNEHVGDVLAAYFRLIDEE